jgi:hypothetical protein
MNTLDRAEEARTQHPGLFLSGCAETPYKEGRELPGPLVFSRSRADQRLRLSFSFASLARGDHSWDPG